MNKKKIVGYILMIIGVLIPLFLSFNMSKDILTQEKRHKEFIEKYNEIPEEKIKNIEKKVVEYNDKLNGENLSVDPFGSEGYDIEYKISEDPDMVFAYISIPSIDVSEPIYLGASEDHLISGFAHVDGTSLPIGGKGNRSVIAGHRGGYYGRLDLLNADKIKDGDILRIDLGNKILEYKMVSREIISPNEWEKLKPIDDRDILTLLTCDPFPTAENRMLVNFERVYENIEEEIIENNMNNEEIIKIQRNNFLKTENKSVNTMKYILFISSILLILLLIWLLVRLIILLIKKK